MRKEISSICIGIGIEIILFLVDKQYEKIPISGLTTGYIVGGLAISYGLFGFISRFFPITKVWRYIMSIRFRISFFRNNQKDNFKEKTKTGNWLQQTLINDKEELRKRIFISRVQWLFNHIGDTEPFIDVILQIINAAVFPINIINIDGSLQIQGTKCNWDAKIGITTRILHGEANSIIINQRLLKDTVNMMITLNNERNGFMVNLDTCNLVIQAEVPNTENKPIKIPIQIREQVRLNI